MNVSHSLQSTIPAVATPCDQSGPLFADTGIKLAVFGSNVSAAGALSCAAERHEISWQRNLSIVQKAERAGFDAAVPLSRWRGFEGSTNPWGNSFDAYTWAAAMAAVTTHMMIFVTAQCMTASPVAAAKQLTTIDHISSGRVGLNVVAGWFEKELRMFGKLQLDHDERYDYAEEWLEVIYALWTRHDQFDFTGRWQDITSAYQQPKNIQQPRPPVMNAAFSPRGHRLAAKYADILFVSAFDPDGATAKVKELRALAAELGREIKVWMPVGVICADSDAAAGQLAARYEREADAQAVANNIEWAMGGTQMPEDHRRALAKSMAITGGSYPLIGSAGSVADQIEQLSAAGVDGLCLTWMNYEDGLDQFSDNVLPLLRQRGVRRDTV
jgi:dimethylsulfone monooxygenase